MINYNISLNNELAQIVEQKIQEGKYANRSEFFREMIRRIFVFKEPFDIETIMPCSASYKKLKKMSKEKEKTMPYSQFVKQFK